MSFFFIMTFKWGKREVMREREIALSGSIGLFDSGIER
jgi:hypothetical protein